MTPGTYVDHAIDRVESERSTLERKRAALERFGDRIADVETVRAGREPVRAATGAVTGLSGPASGDQCSTVRSIFEETVGPHVGESLPESIAAELGEAVALALSPTTSPAFTPAVRQRIDSAVEARVPEIRATERALADEKDSLEDARGTVESVTGWLVEANATPLTDLGFDALAARHERLAEYRRDCTATAERRQAHLGVTTSLDGAVAVGHRELAASLYDGFAVGHPVLATVAELLRVIGDCGRAVRDHLVRRA